MQRIAGSNGVPNKDAILVASTVISPKAELSKLLQNEDWVVAMVSNFQQKVLNNYTQQKNAQKDTKEDLKGYCLF